MTSCMCLLVTAVSASCLFAELAESKNITPFRLCDAVWTTEKQLKAEAIKNQKKYTQPPASTINEKDDDVTTTVDSNEVSVSVHYKLKCYESGAIAIECKFKSQAPGGFTTMQGQAKITEARYECIDGRPLAGSCTELLGAQIREDKSCVEKAKSSSKSK